MHFQYTYFELQDYLVTLRQSSVPAPYEESFERLSDFLIKMLPILHTEATGIILESSPIPAEAKAKIVSKVREGAKANMLKLLKEEPNYKYLFAALHQFLQQPANSHLIELREMVTAFNAAFQTPVPPEMLSSLLTTYMRTKLNKSKTEGLFEFQKDVSEVRKKYDFIKQLSADPMLASLIADENYPFTKQHLNQLREEDYALIRTHKIARIFLLANFRVQELDPGLSKTIASLAAQEPINPLDHSDKMEIDEIIRLAETTKQNIGLDNLRQLLSLIYKSDSFKISHLIWALRVANSITCKAPKTLEAFFERLRTTTSPFEIAIKESRELYKQARIELNEDIPSSEVYASYRNPYAEPHLLPSDADLEASIQNFEALDKHSAQIKLIGYSDASLKFLLERAATNFREAPTIEAKKELEPYIWAALREILERTTKISLRCNQLINAHLILNTQNKRTVAQIKSGDGQAAMQAIMMAFSALTTGQQQYCAEASVYLAERHADLFKPFYKALELNSTCTVSSAEHDDDPLKATNYSGNIVYGIVATFRVVYLVLKDRHLPYFNPEGVSLHVTSVASLLQKQSSQLGSSGEERSYETSRVFHDIWEYISTANQAQPPTHSLESFTAYLIEKRYFTAVEVTSLLNQFKIRQWYKNAILALSLVRNVHYQIQPSIYDGEPAVVISGAMNDIDEWPGGLHQIICARESLRVPVQRKVSAIIEPYQFFNLFSNLFIVTNTIGSQPCEKYLVQTYSGMSLMKLPEHRPSKATYIEPIVSNDQTAQYHQLLQDVKQARQAGQPLLLLFKTIKETSDFYTYASLHGEAVTLSVEESTRAINSLTGLGLPGNVVCATFDACQFDIVPTPEAEANGGLGILLCSPPASEYEIAKHFAKTGQQGRRGFFGFRLERNQLLQQIGQSTGGNEELLDQWLRKLRNDEESASVVDERYSSYADLIFALQKLIYDFQNPNMTLIYREYLGLLQEKVNECYQAQIDFYPEFIKILSEMIQSAECDLNALSDLARKTNNSCMLKFLDHLRALPSLSAAGAVGITLFGGASASTTGTASSMLSMPQGKGL